MLLRLLFSLLFIALGCKLTTSATTASKPIVLHSHYASSVPFFSLSLNPVWFDLKFFLGEKFGESCDDGDVWLDANDASKIFFCNDLGEFKSHQESPLLRNLFLKSGINKDEIDDIFFFLNYDSEIKNAYAIELYSSAPNIANLANPIRCIIRVDGGFINTMDSDDELISALTHEYGHCKQHKLNPNLDDYLRDYFERNCGLDYEDWSPYSKYSWAFAKNQIKPECREKFYSLGKVQENFADKIARNIGVEALKSKNKSYTPWGAVLLLNKDLNYDDKFSTHRTASSRIDFYVSEYKKWGGPQWSDFHSDVVQKLCSLIPSCGKKVWIEKNQTLRSRDLFNTIKK